MNKAWLMAAPLGAALLLGGWQLWPAPSSTSAKPPAQEAGPSSPLTRQAAPSPDENSLQARYEAFLAAEGSLTVPTDPGLASLQVLFDEREQLRQQSFTPAEQEQLFAEDRLMEQWTLRRKALAEAGGADKPLLASELELWLAEQPQWFREAEANSRLLGDLQSLERLPAAERDAVLREQLGPEAADRLHQLTESQQGFEQQLAGYLAEIKPLPAERRAEQQSEILARWFEPDQWRRVEALTRLRLGE
ncbi:lipase secretion chaperone [Aeromonas hydrophila]|uniref:lipase secretion chaperone n=1 Tax=Aeromonas hydrophila TaxID=644 RepID=UPI00214ED2AC|nr:lipase secretion chaperone [Aeromonas hydrophila]MCR3951747.1 lipase chaperone [Aeromonas hydrophila]MCW4614910.1 lipase secretion chaperone [Aeromonas hydrophila]